MLCPNCKRANPEGSNFCGWCGQQIRAESAQVALNFHSIPHIYPLPEFVLNVLVLNNRLLPVQIKQMVSQVNDCQSLLEKTRNPRVFFERYDFLCALLFKLQPYEHSLEVTFSPYTPSFLILEYLANREDVIRQFLSRNLADTKFRKQIEEYDYLLSGEHKRLLCESELIPQNQISLYDKKSKIVSLFSDKWLNVAKNEFVVIDIETTGLSKTTDYIVELAAVRYSGCQETEKCVSLINPRVMIPPEAVAIHHITNAMVHNAPTIEKVLPDYLDFLGDSLIVGHNVNFDIGFIEVWSRRLGYDPSWNYIDTIAVSKKMLPGLENYKQQTILNAIGYQQNKYHRAEDDCRGCAAIMMLGISSLV